jgi:hypothetical protein
LHTTRKTWTTPALVVFGAMETLTLKDKKLGKTDGLTLNGVPISG